ncbi:unannotated protein [freshwater metagenome]|uniref:Unannotated protein n=1 Tax=freshwater metagenome TaxID=449393 RepID=A0A6J7I098_9ZZZZ
MSHEPQSLPWLSPELSPSLDGCWVSHEPQSLPWLSPELSPSLDGCWVSHEPQSLPWLSPELSPSPRTCDGSWLSSPPLLSHELQSLFELSSELVDCSELHEPWSVLPSACAGTIQRPPMTRALPAAIESRPILKRLF